MTLAQALIGLAVSVITAALLAWVGWTVRTWLRINIAEPVAQINSRVEAVAVDAAASAHLSAYHLGPNGGETPIHERLSALETQATVAEAVQTERAESMDRRMTGLHDAIVEVRSQLREDRP